MDKLRSARALCLGKFIASFGSELRAQELLIRYHDRLCELRELPNEKSGELTGASNVSQPVRSEPNPTSLAADSRR